MIRWKVEEQQRYKNKIKRGKWKKEKKGTKQYKWEEKREKKSSLRPLVAEKPPPHKGFIYLWHLVKVGGSSPCYTQSISPHKPPPLIPIMHHSPCLSKKTNFFVFKQSFTESIHLFRSQPSKRIPIHIPTFTLIVI